jgi:hypothetical protein
MWNAAHEVVSRVGTCRRVAGDKAVSIGPGVQTALAQLRRCHRRRPRGIGRRLGRLARSPDEWRFPEGYYRGSFNWIYNI